MNYGLISKAYNIELMLLMKITHMTCNESILETKSISFPLYINLISRKVNLLFLVLDNGISSISSSVMDAEESNNVHSSFLSGKLGFVIAGAATGLLLSSLALAALLYMMMCLIKRNKLKSKYSMERGAHHTMLSSWCKLLGMSCCSMALFSNIIHPNY